MSIKTPPLTIGRLAKAAKVNVETVRHYQRQSLITEPKKPDGGFRHYPAETIDRIRFIKRAQQLGFSLKEIAQLLFLGEQHCDEIQMLAEEKRDHIQQQVEGLMIIQSALNDIIASCENDKTDGKCALIKALSEKGFLNN